MYHGGTPNGDSILALLIKLLEKQEGVKVTYKIGGGK